LNRSSQQQAQEEEFGRARPGSEEDLEDIKNAVVIGHPNRFENAVES
jgi:hypothetical protein